MNNAQKKEAMQELIVRIQHNMITRQQFFAEVERLTHAVERTAVTLLRPMYKIPLKKY